MNVIKYDEVIAKIIEIREQKVILDSDVAELYGVETKRINEAVKNNVEKFPEGYVIDLLDFEWGEVRSKFSTSPLGGGRSYKPRAFSERGLYMLATILKSPKAVATTIAIIETFAQIKTLTEAIHKFSDVDNNLEKVKILEHGFNTFAELMDNELITSQQEMEVKIKLPFLEFKKKVTKVKK